MSQVAKIFSANDVLLDLDVNNKQALFDVVGKLWEDHNVIKASEVISSLHGREKLGSTGLGLGVAIPHARVESLATPTAIFVRTKKALEFDSPDGAPVNLFFFLLVPADATEQHLQVLAEIVEMLANAKFREHLQSCDNPAHAHELFVKWK